MRSGAFAALAASIALVAFVSPAVSSPPFEGDVERANAERLAHAALASDEAMKKLTYLCDFIGHRLSGSPSLERAVDWAERAMIADGLESVERQPVTVPVWVRGEESASLVEPRFAALAMLGLGQSVGTPSEGITAPVVVAESFDALRALPPDAVRGRIVLWNAPFTSYGETVKYRTEGWREASKRGAVASLTRTVGRGSLQSPHTGSIDTKDSTGATPIPAAALSIEDAKMLARMSATGTTPVVKLIMGARMLPDAVSHNVLGQVTGRELPHEIVAIGGHLDSWDVGQGAHDDGGGCVVSMEAVRLLKELGIRPRRTVRVVLWTNEENGTAGADEYHRRAVERGETHAAAIESDGGVEPPYGFGLTIRKPGTADQVDDRRQKAALACLMQFALWFAPFGADSLRDGGGGADIAPLMRDGVPGLALCTPMEFYWDIHHSHADTVDKVDPEALRKNVAAMAVMAYLLAEMPERL